MADGLWGIIEIKTLDEPFLVAGLKPLPSEFGILPIGEMLVASDWLLKEFNLSDRVFFNSRNSTDYIVYGHLSSWKNELSEIVLF